MVIFVGEIEDESCVLMVAVVWNNNNAAPKMAALNMDCINSSNPNISNRLLFNALPIPKAIPLRMMDMRITILAIDSHPGTATTTTSTEVVSLHCQRSGALRQR